MKRILGLDLGTTSIGWAVVDEAEKENEQSKIIKAGSRVVPLSTDEENDFKKGNSITINADRTLKRGARRNKFRYQLRRKQLINALKRIGFINENTKLTEDEKGSTHQTYQLRAEAVTRKIEKNELARVLLMINKKRGYKSSRKANNQEEGELIDGMEVAKKLYNQNLTPGQFSFNILKQGKKVLPEYYRSDLQAEYDKIWQIQGGFYPDILTKKNLEELHQLNKNDTARYFKNELGIERVQLKGSRVEKKYQTYALRSKAINQQIELSELAFILTEINAQMNAASGYLSEISDRSKKLYFNDLTVGQYQWEKLKENPHYSLKNEVFYRQDYDNEFEAIWKKQAEYYPELTNEVKQEIKHTIIFYQRRLKSQKGLISYCEFESWKQKVVIDGQEKEKIVGHRVIPKSSPLFQQFKIWQNINSLVVSNRKTNEEKELSEDTKKELFKVLNWTDKLTVTQTLTWLGYSNKEWKINLPHLEGNRTNKTLLDSYKKILLEEGYDNINFKKLESDEMVQALKDCFEVIGINSKILDFNPVLPGNDFSNQPSYKLWHLLYSYEDDYSKTGNASLIKSLQKNFGFKKKPAEMLSNIVFQDDYGNLSARAIRKIYPFLEDGLKYSEACEMAGYNHSSSITKLENENRRLDDKLEILKKNSLRNPVVEKILNQMINLINFILEDDTLGRPDEIRIELARELKNSAEQRKEITKHINKATKEHEKYREIIKKEFGLPYVSRNDLIRYKLYKELEPNGYKTLYSNTYIEPGKLFSKEFDIEHIIPKARLFDDSFSNKTLEARQDNLDKGNETALDYVRRKYNEADYRKRVEELFKKHKISYSKRKKLLMSLDDIPEDFLARDLGNTAYIARKAAILLLNITRKVTLTTGKITSTLREDWGLMRVMQELNWDKYEKVGLTYYQENKNGKKLPRIKDWTKRNDHRHHAMDAITVAFTKPAFIQYLNNLNARSKKGGIIQKIEEKYTYKNKNKKRKFIAPMEDIRAQALAELSSILVSHKAKNKVTTKNRNKIKIQKGYKYQTVETPRGQLHKETIYGKSHTYKTKLERIGSKFTEEHINKVASKRYRQALLNRLKEFEDNPKKAFTGKNSLSKNPIYINNTQETVPEKVKLSWLEPQYTIRKNINKDLKIEKVVDVGVRKLLEKRLKEFGGKKADAFSNLEENPIWLNKDKGIAVKKVTITGVANAEPLHKAKDHLGNIRLDSSGNSIPTDYVSLGNNHHVAIYRDNKGKLQEEVVSFYEAVTRKNSGLPIVNKNHEKGWEFLFTMKQNELFVFPSEEFDPSEIDLLDPKNKPEISKHLFRVQKFTIRDYFFRHHIETDVVQNNTLKGVAWIRTGLSGLIGIQKVRINHLGDIVQVGEY